MWKVPAVLIPYQSAKVISFRCPTPAYLSGASYTIGDSIYGRFATVQKDTISWEAYIFLVLDVQQYWTLAYTELIGMAFRWAIPYLINMTSTKAFV